MIYTKVRSEKWFVDNCELCIINFCFVFKKFSLTSVPWRPRRSSRRHVRPPSWWRDGGGLYGHRYPTSVHQSETLSPSTRSVVVRARWFRCHFFDDETAPLNDKWNGAAAVEDAGALLACRRRRINASIRSERRSISRSRRRCLAAAHVAGGSWTDWAGGSLSVPTGITADRQQLDLRNVIIWK